MMRTLWMRLTGGRPMTKEIYAFRDVVAHKSIFIWRDFYGRYWMANTRWGWFRVRAQHGPDIWR